MKILLVEDDPVVVATIKNMLEEMLYQEIVTADSYESAVAAVREIRPDIALVDIELKGSLTGIHLGKWLLQSGIRHIYLTGQQDPTTFASASETSPFRNMPKPIRFLDLRNTLSEIAKATVPNEAPLIYLIFDSKYGRVRVFPDNVVYVEADDNYTHIYSLDGEKLTKQTVTKSLKVFLSNVTDWPHLLKIHRSHAINVNYITGTPQGNFVEMKTGVKLEVAVKYKENLKTYLRSI